MAGSSGLQAPPAGTVVVGVEDGPGECTSGAVVGGTVVVALTPVVGVGAGVLVGAAVVVGAGRVVVGETTFVVVVGILVMVKPPPGLGSKITP